MPEFLAFVITIEAGHKNIFVVCFTPKNGIFNKISKKLTLVDKNTFTVFNQININIREFVYLYTGNFLKGMTV